MSTRSLILLLSISGVVAFACTPSGGQPAAVSKASPRPTCDAIDHACDSHEGEGGLAKECHDLGESAATPEATCVARKAECLAACPRR